MRVFSNLKAVVVWKKDSADFYLQFQVEDHGIISAEVATLSTNDVELQDKLKIMIQAYRMGQKFPPRS